VLGGLLTDIDTKTIQAVPFVSEIPIIGWLFKNETNSKTKSHLIILITPHILRTAEDRRAGLTQEIMDVQERIRQEHGQIVREALEGAAPAEPENVEK
jgi:general secretion pathway protein D